MKWAFLTLISIFICICCGQMLEWDQSGNLIAHSYSIWGDWSAHFTFISSILNRGVHWISGDNPIFFGMPFQYPFLSHLFTAFFSFITHLDVVHATYYSSLALLFCFPFILYHFFSSIGLTVRQSILGVILFIFLGGLQAFDSSLNLTEPFTNQFKSGSVFTQIVLFELFPQRAFLFGILFLLSGLSFAIKKIKIKQFSKVHFFGLAIYFSFLAWMHLHSWITLATILLVYFAFSLTNLIKNQKQSPNTKTLNDSKNTQNIFLFGLMVIIFSLPLVYFLLFRSNHSEASGFASITSWDKWYPGWAQNSKSDLTAAQEMNPLFFWIYNTGIFIPLAIAGKLLLWRRKIKILESPIFILATAGSFLFLIAEFFNIQPYFYDNLKLFTFAFLLLTPFAAIAIDALFQKKILIPVALILIGVQIYTSVQDFIFFKDQKQTVGFLSKEEFDLAEHFRTLRNSPDSLVIIAPKHNHWIPTLTGNPVLMGYPGWLWTWGISYSTREAEVNEVLSGGPHALEIITKYPIEYIVVNDRDVAGRIPVSIPFLRTHFSILMEHGQWHVFKIKSPVI